MLPLIHKILEFFLIQSFLLLLLFNGFLNGVLVCQDLLVQLFTCVLSGVELPLLPHYLQSSVHVAELKVRARVRADVPVLVDRRAQYYSLVEKIGDLLVSH